MPGQRERNRKSISLLQRSAFTLKFIAIYAALQNVSPAKGGASSAPKNLVTNHATSDTLNLTTTNSNQFQNEYQYRQTASKPTTTSIDRHKLSTSSAFEASYDHTSTEFNNPSSLDYSYLDTKSMTNVPDCRGRVRLNGTRGFITEGPGYYQTNLQCIWLIDSGSNNATIRIQIHQFNTECNYDYLYVFDGDSVYSPLIAALSGDMKDFSSSFGDTRLEDLISLNSSDAALPNSTDTFSGANITLPASGEISSKNTGMVQSITTESQTFELRTHSGKAFIYFHSDTAQTMPGFYMTYNIDSCPLDCSNRGECDYKTFTCRCNLGFYGEGCQYILCPNNCTSPTHGICDKEKSCLCSKDFTGRDCSKKAYSQNWKRLSDPTKSNPSRAFHQSVIVEDVLWIFGGKSHALSNTNMGINKHRKTSTILAFDLAKKKWINQDFEGVTGQDHLAELSGHSVVAHGKKVFIYGGMSMNGSILNTLTVFDTGSRQLFNIPSEKTTSGSEEEFSSPLSVTGHSANMIDGHMYVFMGYNPLYGYLNFVQKFNIANNTWTTIKRRGSSISGCIGHTSTFDTVGRLFYIYGGHNALTSNKLYSFDPHTEIWTYLLSGPSYRYYHSAMTMNNLLMIIGGNSYNSTHPDQCFQQTHLIYDLNCGRSKIRGNETVLNADCRFKCWSSQEDTSGILKRHGHSVSTRGDEEIILFGGFNGIIMNDLRSLHVPSCSNYTEEDCNKPKFGLRCNWNIISLSCESDLFHSESADPDCSKGDVKLLQAACQSRETCSDCLNTNFDCVWCATALISQCQYNKCKSAYGKAITAERQCLKDDMLSDSRRSNSTALIPDHSGMTELESEIDCKSDNCYLCQSRPHCAWQNEACAQNAASSISSNMATNSISPAEEWINSQYHKINLHRNVNPETYFRRKSNSLLNSPTYQTCDMPCFTRRSCNECTTAKCIWCSTTDQCIESSAYFAYHAMGQCMHYVAHMLKCPVASCSDIETCDKCLANPKCGWLNDISNTGKGRCIDGNSTGPFFGVPLRNSLETNVTETSLVTSILPNWFYAGCPACQCNGHSYCQGNSSVCIQPCQDNTEGLHCDRCVPGYYGDPVNGGSCRQCRCNGHAQSCNRETGKCYCSTKGISGHFCNRCDDKNYYIGDPSSPGNGTCYYNLTTDYQYTFNMSKPEDHFYSDINFINVPFRKDSDVDFSIACSRLALVNITTGTSYSTRRPLHTGLECGSFRLRIPFDRHLMTEGNFSFFVHVYKFQTPFILQIAFSQHRTLYLPHFFFTFSCLFLFFFALSGLAWKLKQEYDNYVRRQRQFIEMEQMASRPFSTILLEMFRPSTQKTDEQTNQKHQAEPTPISFEPCFGSNVGVFSVFVQLPGKPHLAIGSALVSLNEEVVEGSHENINETRKRSPNKEANSDRSDERIN